MRDRVRRIFAKLSPAPDAILFVNSIEPHLDQSFFYVFETPSGLFEGSVALGLPDGTLHVTTSPLEEETAQIAAKADPGVVVTPVKAGDDRKKWLAAQLPKDGTIGLNYRELTHEDFLAVQSVVPGANFQDASDGVKRSRMVKDAREIEYLRRAAEIGSRVGTEIPTLIRGGMTELELASDLESMMKELGATGPSFTTIVAFGAHAAEPHYVAGPATLERGSSIVCDFGAFYHRYASDITRSFRFGPSDPELRKVHETVEEAQRAALAVVKPGVPGKEVHLAAQRVIDASPWKGRFTHGVGHSIGLAVHDGFGMGPNTTEPLEEGMAITVEPGIYLPGKGGVRIEDDVLVTATGAELLTTAPRAYREVPA
jgi:Xaa-Pro dipeptidase